MFRVRMRRSSVGWLVALGVLGWAALGPVGPASGFTATPSPWSICTSASQADLGALGANLSPSKGRACKWAHP